MNPEIAQLIQETAEVLDRSALDQAQSTDTTLRVFAKLVALELIEALAQAPLADPATVIRQHIGLLSKNNTQSG